MSDEYLETYRQEAAMYKGHYESALVYIRELEAALQFVLTVGLITDDGGPFHFANTRMQDKPPDIPPQHRAILEAIRQQILGTSHSSSLRREPRRYRHYETRIAQLEAALRKYGSHYEDCAGWYQRQVCNCGWSDVLTALAPKERCRIYEYDGAFKCCAHQKSWGAISKPDTPCAGWVAPKEPPT